MQQALVPRWRRRTCGGRHKVSRYWSIAGLAVYYDAAEGGGVLNHTLMRELSAGYVGLHLCGIAEENIRPAKSATMELQART